MRKMLEAQPGLSDATLARMLTERAGVAISRRTVTKYRLALGTRRQGTMKAAMQSPPNPQQITGKSG